MNQLLIILIRTYQMTISKLILKSCRFYPTCSEYTIEAIKKHGAIHGLKMGFIRIIKCHPFHPGGIDTI
jgi:uncharacterized protein